MSRKHPEKNDFLCREDALKFIKNYFKIPHSDAVYYLRKHCPKEIVFFQDTHIRRYFFDCSRETLEKNFDIIKNLKDISFEDKRMTL